MIDNAIFTSLVKEYSSTLPYLLTMFYSYTHNHNLDQLILFSRKHAEKVLVLSVYFPVRLCTAPTSSTNRQVREACM